MFILTIEGREREGAYSVADANGEQILYIFQEEDDAVRYAMMLEEGGSPEMHIIEVDDEMMINICDAREYPYIVITPNDVVIPPDTKHDYI